MGHPLSQDGAGALWGQEEQRWQSTLQPGDTALLPSAEHPGEGPSKLLLATKNLSSLILFSLPTISETKEKVNKNLARS